MTRIISTLLFIVVFAISALAQSSIKVGSAAPAFTGTSIDGAEYDLGQLRGRVVVITFWSTRCAICHSELPKLNGVADRYRSGDVVFLALSMENDEKIAGYLRRNPFRFKVLPNSFGVVLKYADRDRSGSLDMGFPAYFVIDQQGRVQYRSGGYDKTEPLAAAVDKLLVK